MPKKYIFLLSSIILLFTLQPTSAAIITLKSGQTILGDILIQTSDFIKIDTDVGVLITYYSDEIKMIDGITINSSENDNNSNTLETPKKLTPIKPKLIKATPIQPPPIKTILTLGTSEESRIRTMLEQQNSKKNNPDTPVILLTDNEYLQKQKKQQIHNFINIFAKTQNTLLDVFKKLHCYAKSGCNIQLKDIFLHKNVLIIIIPLLLLMYISVCFALMQTACHFKLKNKWIAWILLLQLFLLFQIAPKSFRKFLILFIPLVGFIALIVFCGNDTLSVFLKR